MTHKQQERQTQDDYASCLTLCLFLYLFFLSENWMEGKTMFISASSSSSLNSGGMSPSSSSSVASSSFSSSPSNSVVVNNLSPMTTYSFRIRAENDLGKSDYSQEITVTTTIEGIQGFFVIVIFFEEIANFLSV